MKSSPKKSKAVAAAVATAGRGALPPWLVASALALATAVVFLPALQNGFVNWDDRQNISDNPSYRGLGPAELAWMFTTFHLGHYQPLSWMTLGFDYVLWGMNPLGYHLTSVLIHAANAALFYFVSLRLLRLTASFYSTAGEAGVRVAAVFAALFFAVHPLRVESVAWVTERRDVVSGALLLATLLFYLRAAAGEAPDRRRSLAAALLCYALSLLAKASGITLPVVLLILDIYPLRRLPPAPRRWLDPDLRGVWLEKIPFVALAAVFAVVALAAQRETGALIAMRDYSAAQRFAQAAYGLAFYPWKTLAPLGLSPIYEVPLRPAEWRPFFILSGAAVFALTAALILARRRFPGALAAWACYVAIVAPVLGAAQSGVQLVADRYSYLSCLGWALLAGAGVVLLARRLERTVLGGRSHRLVGALGAVLIVAFAALAWSQTRVWHDSYSLWRHALAVTPESSIAHYNVGVFLEQEGKTRDALDHYREAVVIDPAYAEAHYNLARLLATLGRTDEAITEYRKALVVEPNDADGHNNLGLLLWKKGATDEAVAELRRALAIDPAHAKAHYNLARVFAAEEKLDDAAAHFRRALASEPRAAEIHEALARVLARQGKRDEAAAEYEQAVRLMREKSGGESR